MNRNDAEAVLEAEHNKTGSTDFSVHVTPNDVLSLLTTLRHLAAGGRVSSYHVVDASAGEVYITGYVPKA